jgi:hypothetical protein
MIIKLYIKERGHHNAQKTISKIEICNEAQKVTGFTVPRFFLVHI